MTFPSQAGITPDLAGFAAAQETLRTRFGRDIRFYGPADVLYDPGLAAGEFDDEGIPLDPLATRTVLASAAVEIPDLTLVGSAQCIVVFKPLQTSVIRKDEVAETAAGARSSLNRDLILRVEDIPQQEGATYFEVGTLTRDSDGAIVEPQVWAQDDGELWRIVNGKYDSFGSVPRFIVYGEGTR